jgi:hypothetical protein
MEEKELINAENLTQDDVLELIGDFPLQPLRRKVIITVNTSEQLSDDGVRTSSNEMAEAQYIMACGPHLSEELKPGQKVLLNLDKMSITMADPMDATAVVSTIKLRPVQVKGRIYALVDDGVIDCKDFRDV